MKRISVILFVLTLLCQMVIRKFSFLGLVAVLLLLAGSYTSCTKKKEKQCIENECNVCNPLTDLPWLKEYIKELKKGKIAIVLFICSYKNGTGFLFFFPCPPGIYCDAGPSYVLKNCGGETLCITDGSNVIECQKEFEIDFKNKKPILELNR